MKDLNEYPTPRTDAEKNEYSDGHHCVPVAFARTLERQIAALREALEFYASCPMQTSGDTHSFDSASFERDRGKIARAVLDATKP